MNPHIESWRYCWAVIALPLALLLGVTAIGSLLRADIHLCAPFHALDNSWTGRNVLPWSLFYSYGEWPGVTLGIASIVGLVLSFVYAPLARWRQPCVFLLAVLLIGPALLVNGIAKQFIGRPRPHQVAEFGGQHAFVTAGAIGTAGSNSSFPSGHAAIAFYLFTPAFLFWQRNRPLSLSLAALGFVAGIAVGMARVIQGSHFPTDVLWSAGFVYLTAVILFFALRPDLSLRSPPQLRQVTADDAAENEAQDDGPILLPLHPAPRIAMARARRLHLGTAQRRAA